MSSERSNGQVGPAVEQLDLDEDAERLGDIGDLILSGQARVEEFDLTDFELAFLEGYMDCEDI